MREMLAIKKKYKKKYLRRDDARDAGYKKNIKKKQNTYGGMMREMLAIKKISKKNKIPTEG